MTAPALTDADRARLAVLAASPLAAAAAAQAEQARADRRSALLAEHRAADARLGPAAAAARAEANRLEAIARERHAAWTLAAAAAAQADAAASAASDAQAGALARCRAGLQALGGSAIDEAVLILAVAERRACGSLSWRTTRDPYGREKTAPREPELLRHVERLRELRVQVEALRFEATATPAAVEARCAAAIDEARRLVPDGGRVPAGEVREWAHVPV